MTLCELVIDRFVGELMAVVPVDKKAHHLGRGQSGLGAHFIGNSFNGRKDSVEEYAIISLISIILIQSSNPSTILDIL